MADKFMLRMPDGMRERIAEKARVNNRSMNSEIVAILSAHYPAEPTPAELMQAAHDLMGMLDRWKSAPEFPAARRALAELRNHLAHGRFRQTEDPEGAN